ncbi:MAG: NADH-quinone oxidoreductase subunit C [Eggerthellaceae bacterium]
MALHTTFAEVRADELVELAEAKKNDGYRFVQMLCVNTEEGIDALYSFMKGDSLENYTIKGIDAATQSVPSVTGSFLAAFPFENEAHDLFGLNVTNIAIDFKGGFYKVAMDKPMTVISPAQKAAREKAAKIAAAKASCAKPSEEDLDKKLAGMDPEKAAKVRAAMEAKAKREAEKAQAESRRSLKRSLREWTKKRLIRAAMEAKGTRVGPEGGE